MRTNNSESLRRFNLPAFIENIRAQQLGGPPDRIFDQSVALFQELKIGPALKVGRILSQKLREDFELEGIESYARRLKECGVEEETLCVILLLFATLPRIDAMLRAAFGGRRIRDRKAKVLREAAEILDEIAGHDQSIIESFVQRYPQIKAIPLPREMSDGLHCYANAMSIGEQLRDAFEYNSGVELAKFTLASAIHRITGRYHDRETAAVLSVFLGNSDYDETAYRVWRIRTFRRLNRSCSYLPTVLHALNSVLKDFS